jgi:DNA-binding transcriptional ArsR family regulator
MQEEDAMLVMSALSQQTRLRTFILLARSGPDGVSAGDLARHAGAPSNTMSAHLTVLAAAGLVKQTRVGRSIVYRAVPERALAASEFIRRVSAGN